jgi:mono/diheme cytochrome c family protein
MRASFPRLIAVALFSCTIGCAASLAEEDTTKSDAELLKASSDSAVVKQGRENYVALCQACHGEEKAKATLGESPSNLFDSKWYHGERPTAIERNILNGFLEKGMPAWKDALPPDDTTALTAYLLSFQKRDTASASSSTTPSS